MSFHYVQHDNRLGFVDEINSIIKKEREREWNLKKIIPGTVILQPMNDSDLGKGTRAFFLFFIGV